MEAGQSPQVTDAFLRFMYTVIYTTLPYRSVLHLIFNRLLPQCSPTDMQM